MNAANFDTHQGSALGLANAMDDMCNAGYHSLVISRNTSLTSPEHVGARELKWLVRFEDSVNFKNFTLEIGNADDSLPIIIEQNGAKLLDPASSEYTTFESAFEGFCLSSYGNPVTLTSIELVGRNI